MKILVTGSRGFIGSHIATALTWGGHDVLDLKREEPFPKSDLIVHCAAAAGPWHTLEDIWRDNIDLTLSLINFANKDYTPMIFMSSIMVYGDTPDQVVNETTPIYPGASYYAKSKHACEIALSMANFSSVILRLPGVIGPNANLRNWLPNTARQLLCGSPISIFHSAKPFNNVVHIDDLCDFICHLVNEDFDRETYSLGAGSILTIYNTVSLLATCLKVDNPTIRTVTGIRPHFTIDSTKAIAAGYNPATLPAIIRKFAHELLELRAQTNLDL